MTKRKKHKEGTWELFAMQLPAILLVLVFSYLPMFGIIVAFKRYRFDLGIFGSPWNGFDNFKFLFGSNTFTTLIRNTLCYNIAFIFMGVIFSCFVAIVLEIITNKYAIKIVQSSIFVPYFLSWVVVSYISYAMLSLDTGIINGILESLGLGKISFYSETRWWPWILLFFNVWKGFGSQSLIYYGTIMSIDPSLMEAAALDGCTYIKRIRYIVLPHLKQTIIMMTILALGNIFRSDFGMFYYLPRDIGALYSVTDVLDTYIMRSLQVASDIGSSSAAGFIQSVVGFVLVVAVNKIVKKIDEESSLF